MTHHALHSRQHGFTLVEVLVALLVVALTLGAGMKAAGVLTGNAQRMQLAVLGQWCVDNQLTELALNKTFPPVGDQTFECTQMGMALKGVLEVRPTPNPNFRRVDAIIQDTNQQRILNTTTILSPF